jgi:hypothetical protein
MDGEMLEQNLKCPICLTIADEPWETSCCGHIFCNRCIKNIKNLNCPICRSKQVNFRENTFVKMLLNNILVKCPYGCDSSLPIANSKIHRYQCELSIFKCSIVSNSVKCTYEGTKKDTLQHFSEKHSDQMIILAEHFASLKNTYDKHSMFDKLLRLQRIEKEKEKDLLRIKEEEEFHEFYYNEIVANAGGADPKSPSKYSNKYGVNMPIFNYSNLGKKK